MFAILSTMKYEEAFLNINNHLKRLVGYHFVSYTTICRMLLRWYPNHYHWLSLLTVWFLFKTKWQWHNDTNYSLTSHAHWYPSFVLENDLSFFEKKLIGVCICASGNKKHFFQTSVSKCKFYWTIDKLFVRYWRAIHLFFMSSTLPLNTGYGYCLECVSYR